MAKDYFPEEPFACRDSCGLNSFDPAMRSILNQARERLGLPLEINSGCRCSKHNAAIGGVQPSAANPYGSAHLPGPDGLCHAVDIRCVGDFIRYQLVGILQELGIQRIELSELHVHADNATYLRRPMLAVKRLLEK